MKRILTERPNGLLRVQYELEDAGLVEQSHRDTCDINSMVARARRGTFVPPTNRGVYGDFTNVPDYQTARNRLLEVEATFFALPSELREKFNNDPGKVLEFLDNPENQEECYNLGLIDRPKPNIPEIGDAVEPQPTAEPVIAE